MDRQTLYAKVSQQFGVEPDFPWQIYPNYAVFRHQSNNKWFGLVMNVPGNKIGLATPEDMDVLDIKVRVEYLGSLRLKKGVLPAYHMNKENWVSIVLDGSLTNDEIVSLLTDSFNLTC